MKQIQSTKSNMAQLEELMSSMMILMKGLDKNIIYDYFVLIGKIKNVDREHEEAAIAFSEIIQDG